MVIDIPVIKDLALTASIGVAVLIVTNLILLPVLLCYVGVSDAAAARSLRAESEEYRDRGFNRVFGLLARFVERRWAVAALAGVRRCSLVLGLCRSAPQLKIGDLDPGAPELRADSRYNRDNAYITGHYTLSSDTFAVIVKTGQGRLPEVRRPWSRPTAWPGRCSRCRACRPRCRWPTRCARSPPAATRAAPSG